MKTLLICLLATAATAVAQDNPLSAFNRTIYSGVKTALLRSAERMPEEKFQL